MTGLDTEPFVMGGGTYARKLPNAFAYGVGGLPIKSESPFKPGHGGAHEPDEAINIENLILAMKIYCAGILAIDKLKL